MFSSSSALTERSLPFILSSSSLLTEEGSLKSWMSGYAGGMVLSGSGIYGIGSVRKG
jgi:hypothetical protein